MKLLLILPIVCLSSCKLFYKAAFGIKNPQIESYHSINEYSKSFTIDSTQIVFAKDSASQIKLLKMFERTPDIIIFKNKSFLPYKSDSITCNASVDVILKNICTMSNQIKTKKTIDFDSLFSCISDPNKSFEKFNVNDDCSIVFINYTKYLHGVNKSHLTPWNKIIKEQKNTCSVKYVFVNLDYLNNWGMQLSSLPKLNLKKE